MRWRRFVAPLVLTLVVLFSLVLRMDALFEAFGPYDRPGWLAATQPIVQRAASAATSERWRWRHVDDPYAGGDPHNYLRFAREMRHFYQAHVREPMFVATTRLSLVLTSDTDVAVSLVSIAFSVLIGVAAYLVGCQIASPAVGLAAAAALGMDRMAIAWAIEGWRDEMFTFFVVLFVWSWIRLADHPSYRGAAVAGVIGAAACLTRITAITCLVPAWLWYAAARPKHASDLRILAASIGMTLVLVAPYVINCAIETGDPLYALNYHTQFYLDREQAVDRTPRSALRYTLDKFSALPFASADTVLRGLTVHPFTNKWTGLNPWYRHLGHILSWLALTGLFAWLWNRIGRFLLLMLATSLVPYMLTWTIPGGAEWRFTLVAYPFYLLAAFWVLDRLARALQQLRQERWALPAWRTARARAFQVTALLLLFVVVGISWATFAPYLIAREFLFAGNPTVIMAGEREHWLFHDGWTDPVVTGNVVARFTTQPLARVRIPLPEARAYDAVFRMDTLSYRNAPKQRVLVALNGVEVGTFDVTWNRARVGEYHARLPIEALHTGMNELTFTTDALAPVGRAGTAFRSLPRDQVVGIRLWYVMLTPADSAPTS